MANVSTWRREKSGRFHRTRVTPPQASPLCCNAVQPLVAAQRALSSASGRSNGCGHRVRLRQRV